MTRQVWPNIVNRDVAQPSRVQLTRAEGVTDVNVYDVVPVPGTIKAEGTKINETLFDQMEQYIKEYDIPIHTTTGTGAAYAVSVPVWSNLTQTELDGHILCIIPNVVSTTVSPTLNMNGLGAKPIYAPGGSSTSDRGSLPIASYLTANVPVYLIYNKSGDCWITLNAATTPVATNTTVGTVKPDTSTVTIDSTGQLSVPTATAATKGLVKPDDATITVDASGLIKVNTATTDKLGIVKPDTTTISVDSTGKLSANQASNIAKGIVIPDTTTMDIDSNGKISVKKATSSTVGIIKPDGNTIGIDTDGIIKANIATTSAVGVNKPDGKTITISSDGTLTSNAKDEIAAQHERDQLEFANALIGNKSGTLVNVDDAWGVKALKAGVDGKSVQDGTPTPDAPIEIDVVDSPVSVRVVGKNLLDLSPQNINRKSSTYLGDGWWRLEASSGDTADVFALVKAKIKPSTKYYAVLEVKNSDGGDIVLMSSTLSTPSQFERRVVSAAPNTVSVHEILSVDADLMASAVYSMRAYIGADVGVSRLVEIRVSIFPTHEEAIGFAYEPYASSKQTITLPSDHNYLASLPDGTRDELVLRADGVAVLVERVGKQTFSNVNFVNAGALNMYSTPRLSVPPFLPIDKLMSDMFKNAISGNNYFSVNHYGLSVEDFNLMMSGKTFIVNYKIANPSIRYSADNGATWSTTDLAAGTSAIPLQKGTNYVWCTDPLSPEVGLEYVQDTNAVINELRAAIVASGATS